MPGWSFAFDATTNDLIDDGKGSFVRTFTAQTHMQLQLQCHAQECWQDNELGSFVHDLSRFQTNPEVQVPDEVRRAFGVLVKRGRIANLEVVAEKRGPYRVDVAAKAGDTSTGQPVSAQIKAGG